VAWFDENNRVAQTALDREIGVALAHLRSRDPVVAALIDVHGPCKLDATRDYFQLMLGTVISQQLSTKAARSIYYRLVEMLGGKPRPRHVLAASDAALLGVGLSRSKVKYVRNVAEAFASRRMGPASFARLSDDEVIGRLTAIKGIGEWSAHMFLMFGLNRLDVFPIGDLGLRNAMVRQYRLRRPPSPRRLHRIGEAWRPYRTIGSLYLWMSYD
jgi:DNA-3-methyladenine glycosylase II